MLRVAGHRRPHTHGLSLLRLISTPIPRLLSIARKWGLQHYFHRVTQLSECYTPSSSTAFLKLTRAHPTSGWRTEERGSSDVLSRDRRTRWPRSLLSRCRAQSARIQRFHHGTRRGSLFALGARRLCGSRDRTSNPMGPRGYAL